MNEETKIALNKFAKYVISQSKANLTKSKKNASKKLHSSIKSALNVSKNSFELSFEMEDYGQFQDKGVSGTKKKYNTPFSYTNKMPPPKALDKWIVRRGIGNNGKFTKRKSLQFAIARSIMEKGIKPSLFFTKPFEKAFKTLPDELIESFGLDVDEFLKYTLKKL